MPKNGYKSITVSNEINKKVEGLVNPQVEDMKTKAKVVTKAVDQLYKTRGARK